MYQWYQIVICLLKFDFFFFTGVTIQVCFYLLSFGNAYFNPCYHCKLLIVVLQHNSAEFGITIAAIPVVLILLVLCGWAVQREIKP